MSCLALVSGLTPSLIMSEDEVWSCLSLVALSVFVGFLEMHKLVLRMFSDSHRKWRSDIVRKVCESVNKRRKMG